MANNLNFKNIDSILSPVCGSEGKTTGACQFAVTGQEKTIDLYQLFSMEAFGADIENAMENLENDTSNSNQEIQKQIESINSQISTINTEIDTNNANDAQMKEEINSIIDSLNGISITSCAPTINFTTPLPKPLGYSTETVLFEDFF